MDDPTKLIGDPTAPLDGARSPGMSKSQQVVLAAYETLFLVSPPGSVKLVLEDLQRHGHFSRSIDPAAGELSMAFAEGQRDMVLHVMRRIEDAREGKHREKIETK